MEIYSIKIKPIKIFFYNYFTGQNATVQIEGQEIFEVIPETDIEIGETEHFEEEDDFDTSESKPATLSNRRLITNKPYVQISTTLRTSGIHAGDKNFVDKLLSSFDKSQRMVTSQSVGPPRTTGRFISTPGGLLSKKIPNGHKYGEYQVNLNHCKIGHK